MWMSEAITACLPDCLKFCRAPGQRNCELATHTFRYTLLSWRSKRECIALLCFVEDGQRLPFGRLTRLCNSTRSTINTTAAAAAAVVIQTHIRYRPNRILWAVNLWCHQIILEFNSDPIRWDEFVYSIWPQVGEIKEQHVLQWFTLTERLTESHAAQVDNKIITFRSRCPMQLTSPGHSTFIVVTLMYLICCCIISSHYENMFYHSIINLRIITSSLFWANKTASLLQLICACFSSILR